MADNRTQTVTIDVISDVMCPWCFIGKRRLERAAAMVEGAFSLAVAWHPFQLDASLPPEGLDRRAYLEAKFGGAERARKAYDHIAEVGRGEGIAFDLDAITVSPNTLDAHRVIRWAGQDGPATQDAVVEALFVRFFTRAEHIGRHAVLADAAEAAGMDGAAVRAMLATDRDRDAVAGEAVRATEIGVTGVPCFIVDRKLAVSGAQAPETLVMAIRQAASEGLPN